MAQIIGGRPAGSTDRYQPLESIVKTKLKPTLLRAPTKIYSPEGQLDCEGFMNGDLQVGFWKFYHGNGNIYATGEFDDNGEPIGVWREYYPNGQIKYESISRSGIWFSLHDANLQILNYWSEDSIPLITDGNGKLVIYFDNGNVKHISFWNNNIKNGLFQQFYETGSLKIEKEYKNGLQCGEGKVYFENGILESEYYVQDGNHIGRSTEYYENGKLQEEGFYKDGKYYVKNFWNEKGDQLLKDGSGMTIRKYGASQLDIYEQYFEDYVFTGEKKISSFVYGGFTPLGE